MKTPQFRFNRYARRIGPSAINSPVIWSMRVTPQSCMARLSSSVRMASAFLAPSERSAVVSDSFLTSFPVTVPSLICLPVTVTAA